jgi:hypothetical protein
MIQIMNKGPRLKLAGKLVLERGLNEVDAERWKICVKSKMTQIFLDTAMIRVLVSGKSSLKPEEPETDLSPDTHVDSSDDGEPVTLESDPEPTMSAKELIAHVKTCTDDAYLESLLQSEHRTTVRAAIIARLDSLD